MSDRHQSSPVRRLARWWWLVVSIGLVLVAAGWWSRRFVGPAPPVPQNLETLDPAIAALVERAADALSGHRRDVEAWMRLGMVYEANGLFRFALACYERASVLDQGDPRGWYRAALTHERIGDLELAIGAMERAAPLARERAEVQWQLGWWLLDVGRDPEAEKRFRRATEMDPRDPAAWFGLARLRLRRGEYARVVEIVRTHDLFRGANASYGRHLLGTAYRQMGRWEEARPLLARGGGKRPDFGFVWVKELLPYRAGLEALRQDYLRVRGKKQGRPVLEKILDLDPHDVVALNELALSHLAERDVDRAVALLQRALAVSPDDFQTNANAAVVHRTRGRPADLEAALGFVDHALAARPESGLAWRLKASILVSLGRADEAVSGLKAAFARDARDASVLLHAGAIELILERWRDAAGTFARVLDEDPTDGRALVGLARAHLGEGDLTRAAAAADRAAASPTANPAEVADLHERLSALRGGD